MSIPWTLVGFNEAFGEWINTELPPPAREVRMIVFDWIGTREQDPYLGVRREAKIPNLWYGAVPGTSVGGAAVLCSYFIVEAEHRVRCNGFATLGEPF